MYNRRVNYVIVGLFVTAMLVAGGVSLALVTGRTGPTDRYHVVLDNVSDVKFGTQVRFEGYPIGQVERIDPETAGGGVRFRVEVSVEQGWAIPDDSVARIGASSFLAAKTIDIAGGESARRLNPGAEIASAPSADIFTVLAGTAGEFSELNRTAVRPLLATLQRLAGQLEADAPQITGEIVAFAERLNRTLAPVEDLLAADNLAAVEQSLVNLEYTTVNLAALSEELGGTLARVDRIAANVDEMIAANRGHVDQSLKDVRYTLGTISRTVDSIVHNLEGSARNMNEFSRLIRQNPGLLLDGTPREAVSPAQAAQRVNDK